MYTGPIPYVGQATLPEDIDNLKTAMASFILREQNNHDLVQRLFESLGRCDVPRAFSEVVFPMGQR